LSSSIVFITRVRVVFFTKDALLRTLETVALETFARRATSSLFMILSILPAREGKTNLTKNQPAPVAKLVKGVPPGRIVLGST
jgi:hypothetical protein